MAGDGPPWCWGLCLLHLVEEFFLGEFLRFLLGTACLNVFGDELVQPRGAFLNSSLNSGLNSAKGLFCLLLPFAISGGLDQGLIDEPGRDYSRDKCGCCDHGPMVGDSARLDPVEIHHGDGQAGGDDYAEDVRDKEDFVEFLAFCYVDFSMLVFITKDQQQFK